MNHKADEENENKDTSSVKATQKVGKGMSSKEIRAQAEYSAEDGLMVVRVNCELCRIDYVESLGQALLAVSKGSGLLCIKCDPASA